MRIGANVSIAKTGLLAAVEESISYLADTFMIYTRSNRGGKARPIELFNRDQAYEKMRLHNIADPVVHAPYLINLASPVQDTWEYGVELLGEDIKRTSYLGIRYVVFHPGAHVGQGVSYALKRIAEGLNEILTGEEDVFVCLETMAGDGSKVGNSFEEIAEIISLVKHKDRLGVCADTCHLYSYGYDIVNDFDGVMQKFDDIIGLDRLKVFHINDSKTPFGSRKDRHENIGLGSIGTDAMMRIVHHDLLADMPLILETPEGRYKEEIAYLRREIDRPSYLE
ncbi:deoxyribonuclease IV [Effusibacillus dendaii]|uniref:Probable endonuclease 4 n=1 Tax=Effusibacillus dendaii TaxID=2743772 RepID=A0A7I8DEP2_9BACL|nr:deoxyribonuclease IV [Effusibacillus dendaii]BCJ86381.1 putative endonuclease 4 [Effusibacillus dendaii]